VVAAIQMLGSVFFQEYTDAKREKNMKTYDHLAFNVDEVEDDEEHDTYWAMDDALDDETLAQLVNDNDEDAAMVVQFEDAVSEAVQNDSDLAAYFSSYQDARRRLTERAKFRGFWPVRKVRRVLEKAVEKASPWHRELPTRHANCAGKRVTGRLNVAFANRPHPLHHRVMDPLFRFPWPSLTKSLMRSHQRSSTCLR